MAALQGLPAEILMQICCEVDGADDLARLTRTSRFFNRLIDGNELLYKQLYLKKFDYPAKDPTLRRRVLWEKDAKAVAKAKRIIESGDERQIAEERPFLARTLAALLRMTDPSRDVNNRDFIDSIFPTNEETLHALICRSNIYGRASGLAPVKGDLDASEKAQASAHLHCLFGKPQILVGMDINIHPYAMSKVYDMRQYDREKNGWGPFVDDGSWFVDWEKLEAIMLVLGTNIRRYGHDDDHWLSRLWVDRFQGTDPYSYRSNRPRCPHFQAAADAAKKPKRKLDEQDPYGITGTYMRLVCFLDYRVLSNYNWNELRPESEDAPMRLIREDEALRVITMSIAVDRIEWPQDKKRKAKQPRMDESLRADVPPGTSAPIDVPASEGSPDAEILEDASDAETFARWDEAPTPSTPTPTHSHLTRSAGKRKRARRVQPSEMPIVHFSGTTRAMYTSWDPNANSRIRGTVQTTAEGEVRWTTVSIFNGDEERWMSECIQVGGPQSARGTIGTWFDRNYDEQGPAGPTAFWKLHDDVPTSFFKEDGSRNLDATDTQSMPDEDEDEDDDVDFMEEGSDEDEEIHHIVLGNGVELIIAEADYDGDPDVGYE